MPNKAIIGKAKPLVMHKANQLSFTLYALSGDVDDVRALVHALNDASDDLAGADLVGLGQALLLQRLNGVLPQHGGGHLKAGGSGVAWGRGAWRGC